MTIVASDAVQRPPTSDGLARSTAPQSDSGFRMPSGTAETAPGSALARSTSAIDAGLVLALQEQQGGGVGQAAASADREAHRRGRHLIEALAALQRALLTGEGDLACLGDLTGSLAGMRVAADPELLHLLRTIQLRGEVEALRQRRRLRIEQRTGPAVDDASQL